MTHRHDPHHDPHRDTRHDGPAARLVFFDVGGRRDLARRAAQAHPGVHFAARRRWRVHPDDREEGERRRPPGRGAGGGAWYWRHGEDVLLARARAVLHELVFPLARGRSAYCFGFPFSARAFEPRPLRPADMARLDLEDIGALLLDAGRYGRRDPGGPRPLVEAARPVVASPRSEALDAAQRAAVEHSCGPARVLAPAGAGKTKTLVSRVAELVTRGADPAEILLLAFNRKAAEQLEDCLAALGIPTTRRLRGDERRGHGGVHCATFNAFGYRYQRELAAARVTLVDAAAQRALMRETTAAVPELAAVKPPRGSDPVAPFLAALARVRAGLEPPESIAVAVESTAEQPLVTVPFAAVHERYARAQAVSGHQSFDDQIYFAVLDLLAAPERRRFVQRRYRYVLVDEFQDLNGAQLALVDILSRPRRELFVVGDDDQLIYGWRFADPRGILEFHERMPPKPWSATYALCTNYRCSRAVVESAARLVANNAAREPKDVRPRPDAQAGAVLFFGAPAWAQRAAALTAFLREQRARLSCEWRELAVLCRFRSQQLGVALALDEAGLPRTPVLGHRLFTHPAARLLRSYLELVCAPDEAGGEPLRALVNRPNRYVPTATVDDIAAAPRPWQRLCRVAGGSGPGARELAKLVERVADLGAAFAANPRATSGFWVWMVVDGFGLEEHWQGGDRDGPQGGDESGPAQVLDGLLLLAGSKPDVVDYLAAWDRLLADEAAGTEVAADTLSREEGAEDRVVIGTIHAAKGREYRAVVIPDYDCDVTRWDPAQIEEERRVVYVGVTRARDTALFTVDTSRPYRHPFLRELVPRPSPGEHEALAERLSREEAALPVGPAGDHPSRARLRARMNEIETLFPETLPTPAPG